MFQSDKHKYNTIPPWNSPYYAWFPLASHIVGCSSLININITLYHLGTVPTMLGSRLEKKWAWAFWGVKKY
jgi:hypothetical protein